MVQGLAREALCYSFIFHRYNLLFPRAIKQECLKVVHLLDINGEALGQAEVLNFDKSKAFLW